MTDRLMVGRRPGRKSWYLYRESPGHITALARFLSEMAAMEYLEAIEVGWTDDPRANVDMLEMRPGRPRG